MVWAFRSGNASCGTSLRIHSQKLTWNLKMDPWLRSHFTQACTLNLHIICLELAEFPSRGSVDMTLAVVWTWTLLWSMSRSENSSCEADDLFAVLQVDATAGTVDSLYTFGAPGTASPGLTHSTTKDGCFPGARVTTQRTKGTGTWTDPITWVTNAVWLWNPKVDLYILDVDDPSKDQIVSCKTPGVQQMPRAPGSWRLGAWTRDMINAMELHTGKVFNEVTSRSSNKMLQSLSKFAVDLSYERDPKVAAQMAKSAGWRVVGAAMYEAGTSDTWVWSFGTQVSYLVQNPRSRDCIVTFQGTNDNVDNLQNIRGRTRPFCGLTLETDRCRPLPGTCRVTNQGDSFVHSGFAAELERMTQHPSWQKNVRERLPSCAHVSAFGHSLGGAMSDLFTACITRKPQDGSFGHEDYASMSWTKQRPRTLPESPTFDVDE